MPKIQMRRDTSANWKSANPTLLSGEWALETDTKKMKMGDGSTAYNALPYSTAQEDDTWQKPSDWVDIRLSSIPNSVYFLVGHSADYTTYPAFSVWAEVSNSGTYDVFVDGIKQASAVASGSDTTLNWQTLALTSGYDVTTPSALRTHIVRVTPTSSSNTLTHIYTQPTNSANLYTSGLLWAHFTTGDYISLEHFAGDAGWGAKSGAFRSVTSNGPSLKVSSLANAFAECLNLEELPVLEGNNTQVPIQYAFYDNEKIQKVHLKNIKNGARYSEPFAICHKLEKIILENCAIVYTARMFNELKITKVPDGLYTVTENTDYEKLFSTSTQLEPFFADLSGNDSCAYARVNGTSSARIDGLKGLTVSPNAPFTGTSPQIDASYTGLDRSALVNLFNSMPTVSDSQVCNVVGATGAADLTAGDLAIATGKGWTVTR